MTFGLDWGSMWVNSESQLVAKGIGREIHWRKRLEDLDIEFGPRWQNWSSFQPYVELKWEVPTEKLTQVGTAM